MRALPLLLCQFASSLVRPRPIEFMLVAADERLHIRSPHGALSRQAGLASGSESPEQAQDFLSARALSHDHIYSRRHLLAANVYRTIRIEAFSI